MLIPVRLGNRFEVGYNLILCYKVASAKWTHQNKTSLSRSLDVCGSKTTSLWMGLGTSVWKPLAMQPPVGTHPRLPKQPSRVRKVISFSIKECTAMFKFDHLPQSEETEHTGVYRSLGSQHAVESVISLSGWFVFIFVRNVCAARSLFPHWLWLKAMRNCCFCKLQNPLFIK